MNLIRPVIGGVMLLALTGVQFSARAESVTYFDEPHQFDAGFLPAPLENDYYKRYDYPYFGGFLHIEAFSNGSQIRNPEDGESWVVALADPDSGRRLGSFLFVYDEPSDCVLYQGAPLSCGFHLGEDETGIRGVVITLRFVTQCLLEKPYRLIAEHTLPSYGGTWLDISDSPYAFLPTRFRPRAPMIGAPSTLKPHFPGEAAQTARFDVLILDDLGCGVPIESADIEIKGTIDPHSGGHSHFTNASEPADGYFWPFDATTPPTGSAQKPSYDGATDEYGLVRLKYTPGDVGSTEKFAVKVSVPAVDEYGDPAVEKTVDQNIEIKIPGLVYLAEGTGHAFEYFDWDGCPHRVDGVKHTSHAHYFTPSTRQSVIGLAALYNRYTGDNLSFNDGSLPNGGYFENSGGGGRNSQCHISHRKGIDIDINQDDTGDGNLWSTTEKVRVGEKDVARAVFLNDMAHKVGLSRIDETGSIHFRRNN